MSLKRENGSSGSDTKDAKKAKSSDVGKFRLFHNCNDAEHVWPVVELTFTRGSLTSYAYFQMARHRHSIPSWHGN